MGLLVMDDRKVPLGKTPGLGCSSVECENRSGATALVGWLWSGLSAAPSGLESDASVCMPQGPESTCCSELNSRKSGSMIYKDVVMLSLEEREINRFLCPDLWSCLCTQKNGWIVRLTCVWVHMYMHWNWPSLKNSSFPSLLFIHLCNVW